MENDCEIDSSVFSRPQNDDNRKALLVCRHYEERSDEVIQYFRENWTICSDWIATKIKDFLVMTVTSCEKVVSTLVDQNFVT